MRIYRVCHRTEINPETNLHVGPYSGMSYTDEIYAMQDRHMNAEHPTMIRDIDWSDDLVFMYRFVCGFAAVADLKVWFRRYRAMLRRHDFVMRVYDVPDRYVKIGSHQVVAPIEALKIAPVTIRAIP